MIETCRTKDALNYVWKCMTVQGVRQTDCCRVAVIGAGRAGSDTVTRLMNSGVTSGERVAMSADGALSNASKASERVLMRERFIKGQEVGGDAGLRRAAIEEFRRGAENLFSDTDIVFITAELGDRTGEGVAPVVAGIARQKGAVTVGIVTMPSKTQKGRGKYASKALAAMRKQCDTVVVIDDDKLMQLAPNIRTGEASEVAHQFLAKMIKEIVETISAPSLINLNFSNFKTVVTCGGMAVVGVGESDAPNRAEEAVRNALKNPSLDVDYATARGALIHVIGDNRMTIEEANHVGEIVTGMMDRNARVIWGASVDPQQEGRLRVTLVMTGVNSPSSLGRIGAVAPQLFNMDSGSEPERSIDLKLNLYQMETS